MTKRPITRQRLIGFPLHPCLYNYRGNRTNYRIGKSFVKGALALVVRGVFAFNLLLLSASLESFAGESGTPPPTPIGQIEETNSQELVQAILQLQGQICSNQLAIEENEKEAKEAAARNAEALSNGLQKIENAFSAQQKAFSVRSARELEAMQGSNRGILIVAGTFAAVAFLAMLITAYFQWRMSKVWAEISTVLPMPRGLGRGSAVAALGAGDQPLAPSGPVEDSNLRLLAAIEPLEKRIQDLEQSSKPALKPRDPAFLAGHSGNLVAASKSGPTSGGSDPSAINGDARISVLLTQGKSRLKENDSEAALRCFNEVLSLNPNHSEALVRKGATLERLKKLNEAFECYDRAIAADDTMTIAYLHKGGLCNRLERFKEALECYEKALRTQDEWGG
jgi:tetratricopeptide (TPR) repeat protein